MHETSIIFAVDKVDSADTTVLWVELYKILSLCISNVKHMHITIS